jgi:hypothetical protein
MGNLPLFNLSQTKGWALHVLYLTIEIRAPFTKLISIFVDVFIIVRGKDLLRAWKIDPHVRHVTSSHLSMSPFSRLQMDGKKLRSCSIRLWTSFQLLVFYWSASVQYPDPYCNMGIVVLCKILIKEPLFLLSRTVFFISCPQTHTHTHTPIYISYIYIYIKLNGLSPGANYTDRATAACRRSDCQLLGI